MDYKKEQAELSSGVYFKSHEGDNKFRMVSEPLKLWKSFDQATKEAKVYLTEEAAKQDPKSKLRYALWVINRETGKFQIAEFGVSVMSKIFKFATSEEYGFESVPAYDMTLVKTGSGMDTEYDVLAARTNSDLNFHEQEAVRVLEPLVEWAKKDAEDAEAFTRMAQGQPF